MKLFRSTKKITFSSSPFEMSFDLKMGENEDFIIVLGYSSEKFEEIESVADFISKCSTSFIMDNSIESIDFSEEYYRSGSTIFSNSTSSFNGRKFLIENDRCFIEINKDEIEGLDSTENIKVVNDIIYNHDPKYTVSKNESGEYIIGLPVGTYKSFSLYTLSGLNLIEEKHYFEELNDCPDFSESKKTKLSFFENVNLSFLSSVGNFERFEKMQCPIKGLKNCYVYLLLKNIENEDYFMSTITITL